MRKFIYIHRKRVGLFKAVSVNRGRGNEVPCILCNDTAYVISEQSVNECRKALPSCPAP